MVNKDKTFKNLRECFKTCSLFYSTYCLRIFWCTHSLHFSLKSYSATSSPECRTLLPRDSDKCTYHISTVIYSSASAKIKAVSYW